MTVATDRSAKMLERVRALLAKAASTDFPEEAESFRAKADELMTSHAIEMWQVEAAQGGVNQREMPEKIEMDFSWYWDNENTFRDPMWSIFCSLSVHCRCVKMNRFIDRTIPVLGLPADLRYLDMLFTHLMLDLSMKINPKPNAELSVEDNLMMLKEAGMGWPEITRLMAEAGLMEYLTLHGSRKRYDYAAGEYVVEEYELKKPWEERKNYGKPAHMYRTWCKKTGTPQSYTNPKTYRRNFAAGYAETINARLSDMRRNQRAAYDESHTAGGMDLVVRDIHDAIRDLMWELYPSTKPHPESCECEGCHAKKCRDPKCMRPACKEARKPVRFRVDNRRIDRAARNAGAQAGREAKIQASNAGQKIGEDRGKLGV